MKTSLEFETRKVDDKGHWVVLGVHKTLEAATEGLSQNDQATFEDICIETPGGNLYKDHYHVLEYRNDEHNRDLYFISR